MCLEVCEMFGTIQTPWTTNCGIGEAGCYGARVDWSHRYEIFRGRKMYLKYFETTTNILLWGIFNIIWNFHYNKQCWQEYVHRYSQTLYPTHASLMVAKQLLSVGYGRFPGFERYACFFSLSTYEDFLQNNSTFP